MKIYRRPQTSNEWKKTDEQSLKKWAKDWHPGKIASFDGTIDKSGDRHTDLGIQIEPSDIGDLFNALVRHYETTHADLQKRVETLEDALGKIDDLISFHRHEAPDVEDLISAVQLIAERYRSPYSRGGEPKISWIRWDSIDPQ